MKCCFSSSFTQDVVEVFSLNTVGHVHHFSDDPDLNSVLVFNTLQTENKFAAMHLFQSDRVPVCNLEVCN